ncbi:GNAT family N-acetyltransferase [Macrococcoides canis]|uniref:GNAT family N-acetyltransferase n=1 Tax=Macrococcoides canis TaxID=1855823 RepID=UPI00165DDF0A|nr:GNAT family N-acetyltransferase [Macrococcus canis]
MKIISLNSADHYFNQCMALYTKEFPKSICEPIDVFYNSFDLKHQDFERYHFIAAYENNTLLGFTSFHLEVMYNIGYIVYLVVSEEARGKNIARALMNEAEFIMTTLCEKNGTTLNTIILECEQDESGNSPLESFYEKFGFYLYDIHYYQPGLHNDAPVPMNLFVKTIINNSSPQRSIEHIYRTKYIHCNKIDPAIVEDLIQEMH